MGLEENEFASDEILCCSRKDKLPSLLECLHFITPHLKKGTREWKLWEVHQEWIQATITFVEAQQSTSAPFYPEDQCHPIYHFDRQDAHVILKPIFKNLAHIELTDELIDQIFFERVPIYKDDHLSSPIEFFQSERVKKEALRIAQKVYEYAKGNTLLLLGQTPAYVGEMIKTMDAVLSGQTTIVNVPFSGRPNYLRQLTYKNLWASAFLDIVTPDGEKRFRTLLEQQLFSPRGFQDNPEIIYILDNSSGAGVACFLAFLKRWFEDMERTFPEIVFLQMCTASDFTVLNQDGKWVSAAKPNLSVDECLQFDIPIIFLGMEEDILHHFDLLYDNLRIVPSFNGLHWSKQYFEKSFLRYPTIEARELIKEYQEEVAKLIADGFI